MIGEKSFEDAPTTNRYPETIYYRLLAHEYLPQDLDKILYVDADILCLNDMVALYEMDLEDKLYAAASHTSDGNISNLVNKLRLRNFEAESYFNSGVLLMNLEAIRQSVFRKDILITLRKTVTCSFARPRYSKCFIWSSHGAHSRPNLQLRCTLQRALLRQKFR